MSLDQVLPSKKIIFLSKADFELLITNDNFCTYKDLAQELFNAKILNEV